MATPNERVHAGHLSRGQLKVMSAIRSCRTVVLGGHVARCADCAHLEIAYNSCRNRHCPKCQGSTARDWLAARQAELMLVPYYHFVFFGDLAPLADTSAFEAMLAYLSRYTHRVAISNSRLLAMDDRGVTFRWKHYRDRAAASGNSWIKAMTLPADEFIRRVLLHVLSDGFHRIRHYGLFASAVRAANIDRIRALLAKEEAGPARGQDQSAEAKRTEVTLRCRCCAGIMTIIETFARGTAPKGYPAGASIIRVDTS
ncbi:Zn finger protein HypA/HybF involved in hydrogenase expression [Angulomicrobium tetraedrale]|uniref:Zn finger protein HypA/HybF involved in hydrogenase expression n=1 Tax=Ancylobacter tetraedralis TaxID=217068 RepID=A0A839ZG38_9HYPH|nr:Zn finger protein HypA/HybF involved in hydrogenase expression [Ancylobacter tetraedralis]